MQAARVRVDQQVGIFCVLIRSDFSSSSAKDRLTFSGKGATCSVRMILLPERSSSLAHRRLLPSSLAATTTTSTAAPNNIPRFPKANLAASLFSERRPPTLCSHPVPTGAGAASSRSASTAASASPSLLGWRRPRARGVAAQGHRTSGGYCYPSPCYP